MISRNEAPSGFDIRQNFQAGWVWDFPFGKSRRFFSKGAAGKILGGWQTQRNGGRNRAALYRHRLQGVVECP